MDRQCEVCNRSISREAVNQGDVLKFGLKRLEPPDRQIDERGGYLCWPCGEEVLELTAEIEEINPSPKIAAAGSKRWWKYNTCGLCGDTLAEKRGALHYNPPPKEWNFHMLCLNCKDVVATFLENLPEEPRDGDWYHGQSAEPTIKTSVSEADFEAIQETFRGLEVGDTVNFEAHYAKSDRAPDEYTEASGVVFDVNVTSGMPGVFLEPDSEPGEYRIVNLLRPDRSLAVDHVVRRGETNSLGKVTVLEKIS